MSTDLAIRRLRRIIALRLTIFGVRFDELAKRLFSYAAVGVINTLVDYGIFVMLVYATGVPPTVANIISYSTGTAVSFTLNRIVTFRNIVYSHGLRRQIWRFVLVNLTSLALSTLIVRTLSVQISPAAAKLASIPPILIWGFVCANRLVFSAR
jgi:putative flippase GtrA